MPARHQTRSRCSRSRPMNTHSAPARPRHSPEDVLDDDDALLHHVVHLGLDQLQQHVDAAAGRQGQCSGIKMRMTGCLNAGIPTRFHGDTKCQATLTSNTTPPPPPLRCHPPLRRRGDGHRAVADGAHRLAHKVHVHLCGVLLELQQHLRRRGRRKKHRHSSAVNSQVQAPKKYKQQCHARAWLGTKSGTLGKYNPAWTTVPHAHTWSMLRSFTSLVMMSSFSIFTSAQGIDMVTNQQQLVYHPPS